MRRTLTIAAIMIVLGGIGVFIYFYFFASTAGIAVVPGETSFPTAGQGAAQTEGGEMPIGTPTSITARLVKISTGPVVLGEAVVNIPAANASSSPETFVKYIERQSGNVFAYNTRAGTITRTNNQTVPGIQSAAWLPDATTAFVRYLSGDDFSTVNTYALPAQNSGGEPLASTGFFLPQNIADIAISSTSVLTLTSGVNGSVASLGKTNSASMSDVFSTPLSALRISFVGKRYLAYTKPSALLAGAAFLVDASGLFSRLFGPKNGLVALASPQGGWVLVSYVQDTTMQMELVNTDTGDATQLPVATIADKCVWATDDSMIYCGIPVDPSSDAMYPDDWYQGVVSFSDRIWKIDVASRYAQLVLDFTEETDEPLDATALALDPEGTVLVFINKIDSSLWSYAL